MAGGFRWFFLGGERSMFCYIPCSTFAIRPHDIGNSLDVDPYRTQAIQGDVKIILGVGFGV